MRIALTKFRLGSHSFMVERGKWFRPKKEHEDRICDRCLVIEDEYHITIQCKRFDNLRKKYISRQLLDRPSMYKFVQFLNNASGTELKNLSIFCHKVLISYRDTVLLQ